MRQRSVFLTIVFLLSLTAIVTPQEERYEPGVAAFGRGDYQKAIDIFKKMTKSLSDDHRAWYFLGGSYLQHGKAKDAIKAFEKSTKLSPANADYQAGLAYAYLLGRNDSLADSTAIAALKLDPNQADAFYVLSVVALRTGSFGTSYERAKRAIELNPKMAVAYRVKSEALVGSFSKMASTVIKSPEDRYIMLEEAATDLEAYINLSPNRKNPEDATEYLESIKFFAEYYRRPENLVPKPLTIDTTPVPGETPLRVIAKPRPSYTDSARNAGVQGTVMLRVAFMADGRIRHIMVVKPLESSLDRQAILAARQIKFEPARKNGSPISVVKQLEYTFAIY